MPPLATLSGRIALTLLAGLITNSIGCTSSSRGSAPGLVILVPGVAGDGSWYRNVAPALRDTGDQRSVESFRWGAPSVAFFLNFNNVSIHDSAEKKLAARIAAFRAEHPSERLDIIAHSAGGGVTLGALAKLSPGVRVGKVILLHPSVSPGYPLSKPLASCETISLFHSDRDKTFLEWRTSNFGTYDNVKTPAAGNAGFDLSQLADAERSRVRMFSFTDADKSLGNNGDHFGPLARDFLRDRVMVLLRDTSPSTVNASEHGR